MIRTEVNDSHEGTGVHRETGGEVGETKGRQEGGLLLTWWLGGGVPGRGYIGRKSRMAVAGENKQH